MRNEKGGNGWIEGEDRNRKENEGEIYRLDWKGSEGKYRKLD